jgi:uncharacterized membrane protein
MFTQPAPTPQRSARSVAIAAATLALLFGAVILLVHPAADYSLWYDEAWSLQAVQSRDPGAIIDTVRSDFHPPGYFLLLSAWSSAAGVSERAARFPSLLCAMLMLAVTFRLAADLCHSYAAGALAAVVLAVSPFFVRYAHEARMYAALAAGVTASMWLYRRYLARPRRSAALAYVLVTAAALYTHYLGAFVIPLQLLYAALNARKRSALLLPLAASVLFLPWLPAFIDQLNAPDYNAVHDHTLPTNLDTVAATLREDFFAGQTPLYLLLIAAGALAMRAAGAGALAYLLIWGVGWLALVWGSNTVTPHFQPRNALPALPALAIVACAGMAGLRPPRLSRAAAAALLTVLVAAHLSSYASYQAQDPHYRDAVEALAREYRPGDVIFWQSNTYLHDLPIPHYLEHLLPPGTDAVRLNGLAYGPGTEGFAPAFTEAVGDAARFCMLQTLPVDNSWVAQAVPYAEAGSVHIDAFQVSCYERQ